jgi:hypothetical protein
MAKAYADQSPGGASSEVQRLNQICEFWELLDTDGAKPGETTWRELEALNAEVTKALRRVPMDVTLAETLTAYAALLITGRTDL